MFDGVTVDRSNPAVVGTKISHHYLKFDIRGPEFANMNIIDILASTGVIVNIIHYPVFHDLLIFQALWNGFFTESALFDIHGLYFISNSRKLHIEQNALLQEVESRETDIFASE